VASCTEQLQEAIEEAVVLDEIARHHCIRHRSREQLSDKAVAHGLRPAGLVRRAQGFGKALGHDIGPRLNDSIVTIATPPADFTGAHGSRLTKRTKLWRLFQAIRVLVV
jgi:hypothetical protein